MGMRDRTNMAIHLTQGNNAGDNLSSELGEFTDPNTGVRIRQLTSYKGTEDTHLYLTKDGWYDSGRKLIAPLKRSSKHELYSINLLDGRIEQLTDIPGIIGSISNVTNNNLYFSYRHDNELDGESRIGIYCLDLNDSSVELVFDPPKKFRSYRVDIGGVTADNENLIFWLQEPNETWENIERHSNYPHCAICSLSISNRGKFKIIHEENYWINHVKPSPEKKNIIKFCHEGPRENIDHRIWGLNMESGKVWKIGTEAKADRIDHEYWLQNGKDIGYNGARLSEEEIDVRGFVRYDNTECVEIKTPIRSKHPHSNSRKRFIGDGNSESVRRILIYEYDEKADGYLGPRELATHAWGVRKDRPHPHARFSPDGSTVVFSADIRNNESNIFLADVPDDIRELPKYNI